MVLALSMITYGFYILHGLSIEYDSLVVSLNSKSDVVPFNELIGLLLTHEQRLLKHSLTTTGVSSASSFSATLQSTTSAALAIPKANLASSSVIGSAPSSDTDLMAQFHTFLSSRGPWRGKPPDKTVLVDYDRPLCQLCFKKDHTADRCYKRFDFSYKPPPSRPPYHPKQHQPQQSSQYQQPPQALFVQPGTTTSAWYLDSRASTHISPDLNAFTSYAPYAGADQLQVGDGMSLPILHIGIASLSSPYTTLALINVLHVLTISKPLLSISQLTNDNDVYVKFLADSCDIKELSSHKVILKRIKHNGLYIVSTIFPHALLYETASAHLWYHRPCHTSEASIQHLVSTKAFSCKQNKLGKCEACCLAKSH
jgi:hypothetical protein